MKRVAHAIDCLLFAPSSGHRIAAVRILLGGYLLVYFGTMAPHVELMFSDRGVYVPYLLPDYAPGPALAHVAFGTMLALCVALLAGFRTRVVAPLLLCAFGYHYFLQLAVKESAFDRLIAIDLFVLCFADSGRVLGLDALRPCDVPHTVWPVRMLQLQTVLLYLGPGIWKLFTPGWHSGEVLASSLRGMWATPLAFAIARQHVSAGSWVAASWAVIGFELAQGPLLVMRRTRPLAIVLGIAFHLLNCFVLVIPEFLISLVAYPVFIRETTLARSSEALVRKLRRTAGAT